MTPAGAAVRVIVGILVFIPVFYIVHRISTMYQNKVKKDAVR